MENNTLYEGDVVYSEEEDTSLNWAEYNISVAPNDFNISTIVSLIDAGVVKIPGFQRNYVWDKKRASKLIESLIIGVPIPQIFLYEEKKNSFLVIDGQQRLMSIFFFKKKRFPRKDIRGELRQIINSNSTALTISDDILYNNEYFEDFNLSLPESLPNHPNPLNKKNYSTLDDDIRISFDLKTIRNIIIKQSSPDDGDSVMYEIFNRLNSGGVNLQPQEIRTCMYHSDFYNMLYEINQNHGWRQLLSNPKPDVHMKDVEILLRGFAMLLSSDSYKPSMTKFLNNFSNEAKTFSTEQITYLRNIFISFVDYVCENLPNDIFMGTKRKFNISMFESIFTAICSKARDEHSLEISHITNEALQNLKADRDFNDASLQSAASAFNVKTRIRLAKQHLIGRDDMY